MPIFRRDFSDQRVPEIYGYKNRYLESNLVTWKFNKTVSSLIGSMISPVMSFDHIYCTRYEIPPVEHASCKFRQWLVYLITVIPSCIRDISCQIRWYWNIQCTPLVAFSSSEACIVPLVLGKVYRRKAFVSPFKVGYLCLASHVRGVFRIRFLFNFCEHTSMIAMTFVM